MSLPVFHLQVHQVDESSSAVSSRNKALSSPSKAGVDEGVVVQIDASGSSFGGRTAGPSRRQRIIKRLRGFLKGWPERYAVFLALFYGTDSQETENYHHWRNIALCSHLYILLRLSKNVKFS
jgi:hypothetical protein